MKNKGYGVELTAKELDLLLVALNRTIFHARKNEHEAEDLVELNAKLGKLTVQ